MTMARTAIVFIGRTHPEIFDILGNPPTHSGRVVGLLAELASELNPQPLPPAEVGLRVLGLGCRRRAAAAGEHLRAPGGGVRGRPRRMAPDPAASPKFPPVPWPPQPWPRDDHDPRWLEGYYAGVVLSLEAGGPAFNGREASATGSPGCTRPPRPVSPRSGLIARRRCSVLVVVRSCGGVGVRRGSGGTKAPWRPKGTWWGGRSVATGSPAMSLASRTGLTLEPGGRVHHVADRREVADVLSTDVSHVGRADVHADAHVEEWASIAPVPDREPDVVSGRIRRGSAVSGMDAGCEETGMRIVFIGGGIAGLCGAMLLARDGHQVTVLERDAAPAGPPSTAWDGWQRRGVGQFRLPHGFQARFRAAVGTRPA